MKKLFLIASIFIASQVNAGTIIEYNAKCKYFDYKKQLQYSGKCLGNWGVYLNEKHKTINRYIMTFPNQSEILVYFHENGLGSVNDVPAKTLRSKKGFIKILTAEDEVFEFTEGSE